jgi:hypothetical protein
MPEINIYNNFLPKHIYQEVYNISRKVSWLAWKKLDGDNSTHLHVPLIDEDKSVPLSNIDLPYNFIFQKIKTLFNKTYQPHNLYFNLYKYGDEVSIHTDRNTNKENKTFILYLTDHWEANYHGETIFYNKEQTEILKASIPFPNSAVIFDSSIPHTAAAISKKVYMDRIILVAQMESL